ncbi:MAG: DUF2147 domain-containing protein [Bacteriovoracaceae bacterium]|nr:DUF2147 domain-containing protein [Bacteriovoracaceae bacterium]
MRITKTLLIFTLLFSSALSFGDEVAPDDILGHWLVEEKSAVVEIKKTPENLYYGEIVWLEDLHTGKVKEKLDQNNPEEKLQKRSLLGLKNTWGFKFDGDDEWVDGNIYDPKSGKTYSAQMELEDSDTLELRGYVGMPLFGRTTTWSREDSKIPGHIQKK